MFADEIDQLSRGGPYVLAVVLVACLGTLAWFIRVAFPQILNTYREDFREIASKHENAFRDQEERLINVLVQQRTEFREELAEFRKSLTETTRSVCDRLDKIEHVLGGRQ